MIGRRACLFADRHHRSTDREAHDVFEATIRLSMTGRPAAMQHALNDSQS
jgi:plasmid stability protein